MIYFSLYVDTNNYSKYDIGSTNLRKIISATTEHYLVNKQIPIFLYYFIIIFYNSLMSSCLSWWHWMLHLVVTTFEGSCRCSISNLRPIFSWVTFSDSKYWNWNIFVCTGLVLQSDLDLLSSHQPFGSLSHYAFSSFFGLRGN
jgi:hypothetical protein